MSGERDERYVACPYYLVVKQEQIKSRCVRCEGVNKKTTISLVFSDDKARSEYKRRYCYSIEDCKKCRIHQMLDKKYEV